MEEILSMLNENLEVLVESLVAKKLSRPEPDKVLREVERDGVLVLESDTNAIGIVLRFGLTQKPSLDELEAMINKFRA
jgi:hypothetical protein